MLRLTLPKGRLWPALECKMKNVGINFHFSSDRDYSPITNVGWIEATMRKPRSIPQLIALGNYDAGIVGLDLIRESGYENIIPMYDLGLGKVDIVVAVHESNQNIIANPPKRPIVIASEYENIAHEWAMNKGLAHIVLQTWGSTESFIPRDADIIIDCVDTGATMKANKLVVIEHIMSSTAHIVSNVIQSNEVKNHIDDLINKITH